jgi:hypothetical protein
VTYYGGHDWPIIKLINLNFRYKNIKEISQAIVWQK